MNTPLTSAALFHIGPIPIAQAVLVTWAIMAVLVVGGILIRSRLSLVPAISANLRNGKKKSTISFAKKSKAEATVRPFARSVWDSLSNRPTASCVI